MNWLWVGFCTQQNTQQKNSDIHIINSIEDCRGFGVIRLSCMSFTHIYWQLWFIDTNSKVLKKCYLFCGNTSLDLESDKVNLVESAWTLMACEWKYDSQK